MIDERAVVIAKFWTTLRSRAHASNLPLDQFEQFALMVIGFACVARSPGHWPIEVRQRAQDIFYLAEKTDIILDDDRFRSAWNDACYALEDILQSQEQSGNRTAIGSSDDLNRIIDLIGRTPEAFEVHSEFLLHCFDELFHHVVSRLTGFGLRRGNIAAALAAHLSKPFEYISELFTTTGEFAVLRRKLFNIDTKTRVGVRDRLKFFIVLRMRIYDIAVDDQRPQLHDLPTFTNHGFLLIDHPRRTANLPASQAPQWADLQSSLEALEHLRHQTEIGPALIVVPGQDRSVQGWRRELREYLVSSGRLLAVVDLPKMPGLGSGAQVSAWLLGDRMHTADHVLMIDAKKSAGISETGDPNVLMEFVASVISLGTAGSWPPSGLAMKSQLPSGDSKGMMHAYFANGYSDIEGFCRQVSVREIAQKGFKLNASKYLRSEDTKRPGNAFLPVLNNLPVLEALHQGRSSGTRIYVIGDNGEGKSLLLRDLTDRVRQEGRRVVGISFGLTDRFSFRSKADGDRSFTYLGARTSEHGIALNRTLASVNQMVREVHVNAEKLSVFDAVLKQLGFGGRRYLVPASMNDAFDAGHTRYAELQQLTGDAYKNREIFQSIGTAEHILGLMRKESQGSIAIFSELSSGEQQLLTLALKLIAYVDFNTVVMIDEPELSLHVSWQRSIPEILRTVCERLGCSIVVATHSPIIVASATHSADRCFVARQHALTEVDLRQRNSVETTLFDGFRTYTANSRQVHERCAAIVSQTIQRLNAQSPQEREDLPTAVSLHEELNLMEQTIKLAEPAELMNAKRDLQLIVHTRAALEEILASGQETSE